LENDMADENKNDGTGKDEKTGKAKGKAFRVVHPNPGVHPVLNGQTFEAGELVTDDAQLAKSLTEYGCQVVDADTGKPALGTHRPEEQARIERARQWAFQA